jgi:hypothetical protein
MRLPLLTRGMPVRGSALLFDRNVPALGARSTLCYVTLHALNLTPSPATCALLLEGPGMNVRAPIALPAFGVFGEPKPVVRHFPVLAEDTLRWEAPDDVVVNGYIELEPTSGAEAPEPLRSPASMTAPFPADHGIVSFERVLHTFQPHEQLTLGVDVPAGETLELVFRPEGEPEVAITLPGPLVAYEVFEGVPIGASGTLSARVTTGGAAIVYGCLVRS